MAVNTGIQVVSFNALDMELVMGNSKEITQTWHEALRSISPGHNESNMGTGANYRMVITYPCTDTDSEAYLYSGFSVTCLCCPPPSGSGNGK
ncbi:hypothetical protein AVEN_270444-1 [Araneus ventricosus]|uniref:Uncharacterized protein n=1 Tax=Araneus ventricosus TaxID=182803 RepID=A0A4Y2W9N9_ARAVE|nr:hypothetical protein AVEN_270444-1 [Araneus ventricosus]